MIFYLSGTGNTKWAAKTLAALTNEKLLFIPDMMRQYKVDGEYHLPELADGERVGFCFPVHGMASASNRPRLCC